MTPPNSARVVVLLSGRGTNFQALHEAMTDWMAGCQLAGVISDRSNAAGLELARDRGVDTVCVARNRHPDRAAFENSLTAAIDGFEPQLIVLAGFMRVLGTDFVGRYTGRMINIHPSLLPKYRGLDTHRRALEAGDREHGASVHFVTPELDSGPVISQARMTIEPSDTERSLAERLLSLEHRLLPATVALLTSSPVELRDENVYVENRKLDRPLELGLDLDDRGRCRR